MRTIYLATDGRKQEIRFLEASVQAGGVGLLRGGG